MIGLWVLVWGWVYLRAVCRHFWSGLPGDSYPWAYRWVSQDTLEAVYCPHCPPFAFLRRWELGSIGRWGLASVGVCFVVVCCVFSMFVLSSAVVVFVLLVDAVGLFDFVVVVVVVSWVGLIPLFFSLFPPHNSSQSLWSRSS